jgi:hypothetical protein
VSASTSKRNLCDQPGPAYPPLSLWLLRTRPERRCDRAAKKRDGLAASQLIEEHAVPCQPGAGLQDIELAQISQRVSRAFYNRLPLEADVRVGVSVATDRVRLTGLDAKG